jgi:hypothetical protein
MNQSKPARQETISEREEDLNILVFGESGVGKQTFINAFVNYLRFATLDNSLSAKDLRWVAPHSFTLQYIDVSSLHSDIEFREVRVRPTDDRHQGTSQHSGTQIISTHTSNTTIRLLNTPSIGDACGKDRDRENIASIMSTLKTFDKLHGILILLKPNQFRLTDTFRRYLKELWTHFHKDAVKNIVFCFTDTCISNYKPGNIIEPLMEMLCEYKRAGIGLGGDSVYCFDSGGYRFLAAYKHGVVMGNVEDFRGSWEHSAREVQRLLQNLRSLEPHDVRKSICLNLTRESILRLVDPVVVEPGVGEYRMVHKERELLKKKEQGDELRKRLHLQKDELVPHSLDHPRPVCTNISCVDWYHHDGHELKIKYKTICHDPCYHTNIQVCKAFSRNICKECWHQWQEDTRAFSEVQKRIVSGATKLSLKKALDDNGAEIATIEKTIDALARGIDLSGLVLKDSITPYSESDFDYLDYLLEQELRKAGLFELLKDSSFLVAHNRQEYKRVMKMVIVADTPNKRRFLNRAGFGHKHSHVG